MSAETALEIVSATPQGGRSVLVDFSDGTSAYFSALQLARLASSRMRTAYWPEEKVSKQRPQAQIFPANLRQRPF